MKDEERIYSALRLHERTEGYVDLPHRTQSAPSTRSRPILGAGPRAAPPGTTEHAVKAGRPGSDRAARVALEDGNAGKEAEELRPSPNFCVRRNCSWRASARRARGFILLDSHVGCPGYDASRAPCPALLLITINHVGFCIREDEHARSSERRRARRVLACQPLADARPPPPVPQYMERQRVSASHCVYTLSMLSVPV
jgi:hypothetical protein